MKKNSWFSTLQNLSYLTQVGLSAAAPLVLLLLLAAWLNGRFGVGEWVFLIAIVLGLGGGAASFAQFSGYMVRKSKKPPKNNRNGG